MATVLPGAIYPLLPGFRRLAAHLQLSDPPEQTDISTTSSQPSLVIICVWFGGIPRHVAKYTAHYRSLLPHAQILVVTSTMDDMVWRTNSMKARLLDPAAEIIMASLRQSSTESPPAKSRILLHVISNAGTHIAYQVTSTMRNRLGKTLPLQALVIDSCPSHGNHGLTVNAFVAAIPKNPMIRTTGRLVAHALVAGSRIGATFEMGYRALNDTDLFDVTAPRCYIYSKNDAIIPWQDVKEHIDIAQRKGYKVSTQVYENSLHANHMVKGESYWNSIRHVWEVAGGAQDDHVGDGGRTGTDLPRSKL